MDMIANDESPSQISDKIKEILFTKASDKVDGLRPSVSNTMFSGSPSGADEIDPSNLNYSNSISDLDGE